MNNAMSMLTNVACRCLEKVICFRRKPGQRSRGHGPHHQGHRSLHAGGSACGWKPLARLELKIPLPLLAVSAFLPSNCARIVRFSWWLDTFGIWILWLLTASRFLSPLVEKTVIVQGAVSAAESPQSDIVDTQARCFGAGRRGEGKPHKS